MTTTGSSGRTVAVSTTVRWGVAGAVVTLLCLGLLALLAMPPFLPADESSHAGYALEVADGNLPRLEDTVEPEIPGQRALRYYLANHPPLYYGLVGPVLEQSVESDHSIGGVRLVRGFSLLLAAGTVVVTAALAGVVVQRRRAEAMVLAAGLAATVPTFVTTSASLHNDLLAVFSAALAYHGAALALVHGPRRGNVALICLGSAVTLATRLNGAPIVALAAAALGLATLLHDRDGRARRVLRAALLSAAPVAAAVATSGWFYLRNVRLYGDISGVTHNRDLGGRHDTYTPLGYLTDRITLPDLLTRVEAGGPWRNIQFFGWYDRKALAVVVAVVLGGATLAGLRAVQDVLAWRRGADDHGATGAQAAEADGNGNGDGEGTGDDGTGSARVERFGRWAAIAMLVALPLLLCLQLSVYVSQTGTPNPRYIFPGLPAVAVAAAVFCLAYRRRAGLVVGIAVLAFQVTIGVTTLGRWINLRTGAPPVHPLTQLRDSIGAGDIPSPALVLALLLAGVFGGLVLQAAAMWRLSAEPGAPAGGGDVAGVPANTEGSPATVATSQLAAAGSTP